LGVTILTVYLALIYFQPSESAAGLSGTYQKKGAQTGVGLL